jgi:pimeloyl-ACP methyl ester carboxylesterase
VNRRLPIIIATALALGVSVISATMPSAQAATSSLTAAEQAAGQLPAPAPIAWGPCSDEGLADAGAVCGFVSVPLDWNRPYGAKIKLAVSEVKHTVAAAQYQGIMLVNPGGPGGSGLDLSTLGSSVPNGVGGDYDWIGFDPRGVGSSVPSISCIPTYFAGPRPNYVPSTPALLATWLHRSQSYAGACASAGALLNHMTTEDSAKDMDYIRAALGQKQMSYYGFSYGTYLGQVYSTLFPDHLRRMVLDSTVDPRNVWYQSNLNQDAPFNRNVDIWFGWLAKYNSVYHLGSTQAAVKALWYKELHLLDAHPAGGVVGPDEWTDIFLYAGYYQLVWTDLANVFSRWVNNGDLATLEDAYQNYVGPTDDNEFAVYLGVECTDAHWPKSWSTWSRDNWSIYAKAPLETWGNAWFNAPCIYWPAPAQTPVRINGSRTKSVLMIDETLDAATPYEGSLYVRSLYPNASLIAEPGGTSHADSLFGDACVDDQIAAYLGNGTLPPRKHGSGPDTTCAPLPVPVPPTPATSASGAGTQRPATVGNLTTLGTLHG